MIELVIFDLDGVLVESRQPLSDSSAAAVNRLTQFFNVGIISGSRFSSFEHNVIPFLQRPHRVLLSPTNGAALYAYDKRWVPTTFATPFTEEEYQEIRNAFRVAVVKSDVLIPIQSDGVRVENRGEQVTFSALGQDAPLFAKSAWDMDKSKRKAVIRFLKPLLPDRYHISMGGTTSIDVTRRNVHKGSGVEAMLKHLHLDPCEAVFFGDDLEPDGNDYEVIATGVPCFRVYSTADTLRAIEMLDRTPIRNI